MQRKNAIEARMPTMLGEELCSLTEFSIVRFLKVEFMMCGLCHQMAGSGRMGFYHCGR